jgi:metaxin
MRYEAYQSLLDHRIRKAWVCPMLQCLMALLIMYQLYNLYLDPLNFSSVAHRLYVQPISSNILVRTTISHQLRAAAEAELLKYGSVIDVDDLYSEAGKAFDALSILLGEDQWFFGGETPTIFDASVFAYTQLLLDEKMGWKEKRLVRAIRKRENLVRHRERLLVRYFDDDE